MRKAAARVVARPGSGLQGEQIMPEIKMDRDALILGPIHVGVEKDLGIGTVC